MISILIRMKKNKNKLIGKDAKQSRIINSKLKIPISQYSIIYHRYMATEFQIVDRLIKKIIQMPCCREYYLRYPLEGLLRGAVKKMMLNTYEIGVFGYFLEHVEEWTISADILSNLYDIFPDIIHVNEPTCPKQLKEISMFLYFSCYSVKQLLNSNIELFKKEMQKIFPEFEHLHTHWINSQPTVNFALNPRALNEYLKRLEGVPAQVDYNTCVDKIIQISPCYDLSGKSEKKKPINFGFLGQHQSQNDNYGNQQNQEQDEVKIEELGNCNIMQFEYDGGDI